jgi:hypothetical protein
MWDVASRSLLHTFSGHSHYVYACAFSPDGRLIISSGFDKTVCVRDVSSGQLIYKLYGHSGSVNACAFSPDGNFIISASADKTVQVWNLENRKSIACDTLPDVLESLGVHPWLPKVVCGDYFGNVYPLKIGGFKYGPIIVTAFDRGLGLVVRCPSCQCNHPITQTHLGNELTCPTLSCGLGLKINPFVIQKTDLTR